MTSIDRFWKKVRKGAACWRWTGARDSRGYGAMRFPLRMKSAHRISWTIHRGPIPDGLHVLHRCDNPPCVRPDHLFLGTNANNVADMIAKGRDRSPRGVDHPAAKLTEKKVAEIRRLYGPPRPRNIRKRPFMRELAARFGVCPAQIAHIVNGEHWVTRSAARAPSS